MKKLLLGLITGVGLICGVMTEGWAYTEVNDTSIAFDSATVVSVSAAAWTVVFSSTEVIMSTTTTGNSKLQYRLVSYNIRNNAGSDIDVFLTSNNNVLAANCWYLSDGDVETYTSPITRYARLATGQAGSVNIVIQRNYIRYP